MYNIRVQVCYVIEYYNNCLIILKRYSMNKQNKKQQYYNHKKFKKSRD